MIKKLFLLLILLISGPIFAEQQKPLLVVLDWFINPNHAPLFVAEQEGFFKQQGLEVKFISPADPSEGNKMVAAGKADVAISYAPSLLHHVVNGMPVMRFATLVDKPLNCLVVLKNSNIHTLADLKNKKIASSGVSTDRALLNTMLKSAGLGLKDVDLINVRFDLTQALLAHKIDGFTGGARNFEPIEVEQAGQEARLFYPEKYGFPMYDELIFVTNKKNINDPRLTKFKLALKQGVKYLRKYPRASWRKFATNHPELNNKLNEKAWVLSIPYFATDPAKLDKKRYQKLGEYMLKNALIPYIPKLADYAK